MKTWKINNCIIDEEKEDFTQKTIYTVWDGKGIIHLATFYTFDEAKEYAEKR